MSVAILLAYAAALPLLGAAWLRGAAWTSRAPRLAMFAWFSLAVSVVLALVSAGVLLLFPVTCFHKDLSDSVGACFGALQTQYGQFGAWPIGSVGIMLAIVLPLLLAYGGITDGLRSIRDRRSHLYGVLATAHSGRYGHGTLVLDHDTAAAYCLPGHGGTIVVTTGALRAVDSTGLAAVLHHEQAHLDGRHHLLTALARVLHRPLSFLPLFAELPTHIARLVELRADDVAASKSGPRVLAESLLAFAESSVAPALALPAAGADTVDRMRRLVTTPPRLNRTGAVGIAATGTLAMAVPIVVTAVSLATVTYMACCSS